YFCCGAHGCQRAIHSFPTRRSSDLLETTRPENHGWLTYIYPQVDLWDGKNMMRFAAQSEHIITEDGTEFRSAGLPILYAKLAERSEETRLNSSHVKSSYAVFCLKKK